MNTSRADQLQDTVSGVCMIMASLLLLISSVAGGLGRDRLDGTIGLYAFFLFIFAVLGLTRLLWDRAPRVAVALRLLAIFGCVGSVGFGVTTAFLGAAEQAGASEATLRDLEEIYGFGLPLLLQLPGITFPLSMVLLGIVLWRTRAVPAWTGIALALAGVAYPLGRAPDIQVLFYVADGLFIVSLGYIGVRSYLSPTVSETSAAR